MHGWSGERLCWYPFEHWLQVKPVTPSLQIHCPLLWLQLRESEPTGWQLHAASSEIKIRFYFTQFIFRWNINWIDLKILSSMFTDIEVQDYTFLSILYTSSYLLLQPINFNACTSQFVKPAMRSPNVYQIPT